MRLQPFQISSHWFLALRFRHLAVIQMLELLLLSAPLADPDRFAGRLLLFAVLVPMQFFNRLLGLRLSGEPRPWLTAYSWVFAVLTVVWGLLSFVPALEQAHLWLKPAFYATVALVTGVVLLRFIRNIWMAQDVHEDVLFGVVICYATLTVLGFELHGLNHHLHPGGYQLQSGIPHHSQLMFLSIGGTTTAGSLIQLENSWAQLIFYFQSFFSQVFLVVFVARMIGLHTGRR
ncbi:MAG: hypothetical protein DBW85_04335 [Synechococcus sp. MED-G71]|nr:MAG: hypothetical protein DBW85_04335 [Synechococcus sp. MED-G71]